MTKAITPNHISRYRSLDELTLEQLEMTARANTHTNIRRITLMSRDQLIWAIINAETEEN